MIKTNNHILEGWKSYCLDIELENEERRKKNRVMYDDIVAPFLRPTNHKFLFFKYKTYPHPLVRKFKTDMYEAFRLKPLVPTSEGFLDWCIKNNYDL